MILHYKKYGILLAGIFIAAALNIAGSLLSTRVNFPLYMDSFATIAAAAILGGAPAVLCALFTNGVLTLLGKLRLVFMVCQLMTAVFSWLIFSIERKRTESEILSFDSFMQAGIASAVSNGIFGSIFAAMLHYNLTAIEQGILAATGTVIFANLMGGLLLNLVDKAFAAFIAYGIYRIANKMLQRGSKPYPLAGGLPELSERMAFFSENKHHRHKGGIKPEYIFFVIALLTLILTFFFKHKTTQKFNEAYEAVISESGMSEKLLHVRAEEAFIHQGYYALAYTSFTLIMISFIIMQVRSGEQRKNLALSKVRENAQKAFSRDLHDGAAQSLSALKIALQAGETEKALRFVDSAIREVRELIGYLRIDLSTSFVQIVKRYAAIFQESYGIPVSVFEATACATSFTERTKHELVRIVKEALSNAAQHADATKIEIKLIDAGADFHITVRDNGKGFACAVNIDTAEIVTTSESVVLTDDAGNSAFSTPFARECVQENSPQPNIHIGLESMRERAESLGGTLSVHSGNDGTTICVSMPICAAISDNRGGVLL
ncbi:MAG: hypothetical protein J6I73_08450 [Treponema sp.]|nr:hypothetical protein [Treponema sp.]